MDVFCRYISPHPVKYAKHLTARAIRTMLVLTNLTAIKVISNVNCIMQEHFPIVTGQYDYTIFVLFVSVIGWEITMGCGIHQHT